MKYTHEQKEAGYYLHKLFPYLEQKDTFEDTMCIVLNRHLKVKIRKYNPKEVENLLADLSKQYQQEPLTFRQKNVRYLAQLLHLTTHEEQIVRFMVDVENNRILKRSLLRFDSDLENDPKTYAALAGVSVGKMCTLLRETEPLRRLGIVRENYRNNFLMTNWCDGFVNTVYQNEEECYRAVLGTPLQDTEHLARRDFNYVEAADLALRLMKQAKHTKGFNILLYGVPGTGKTCFAKLLARTVKLNLYPVGENNDGEVQRNYRLQQLYRKQCLLKNVKDTCILFDEAEDIFSGVHTLANKVELNRLLENNERPVIWTTNKIYDMDPAYIRRFTLAVCFNKPPIEVRQKIWHKHLAQNKIACGPEEVRGLAKKYEVPPSLISGAARAARMAKGNLDTVKDHLSFMTQAMRGGYKKAEKTNRTERFSPALIHADMDLNMLTEQLKNLGRLNFSLCLYGASGTGKSAYARYLAEQLGLDVLHRRASDLIGSYVGETEQNIAKAFARAKENKAMLIFDEADSFLRDRSTALRSWEVSSVNEMLTWMESHPYPFICTTNLMDTLDSASLRRFSFKVKYDFLTAEQVREAFRYFFGLTVNLSDVSGLDKLTPGDFALVKNKAEILGKSAQWRAVREMLETEQKLKHSVTSGIGFRVN